MNVTGYGAKSDLARRRADRLPWLSRLLRAHLDGARAATDHTLADSLAQACHPTPSAAAAALVGRAEAAVRAEEQEAERQRHQDDLAASRRRAFGVNGDEVGVVENTGVAGLVTAHLR